MAKVKSTFNAVITHFKGTPGQNPEITVENAANFSDSPPYYEPMTFQIDHKSLVKLADVEDVEITITVTPKSAKPKKARKPKKAAQQTVETTATETATITT